MATLSVRADRGKSSSRLKWIGIVLVGVIVVVALAVWVATIVLTPHPPSPSAITEAMREQAALTGGAKVYATHCAYCHDKGFGPSIAHLDLSPDAVRSVVRSGPAMMPAFPITQVSDDDVKAVTRFINSMPAKEPPPK